MVSVAKCALMGQKVIPSLAQLTRNSMLLIIVLTATTNVLYILLTCNKCKTQYVGKTVDDIHLLWNNYKGNKRKYLRKESCMQQHLFECFSSEDHNSFLDDVSIIFIDKTDLKDPNKWECYWRHTLKTIAPQVLNVEDDCFLQFCFISHTIYSYNCLY